MQSFRGTTALIRNELEHSLNAAFATNELRRICRVVDAAVLQSGGVVEIARAAGLDRVTLYRAFRLERGPSLDTMIKILRVLGFELIVEVHMERATGARERRVNDGKKDKQAATTARRFTTALKTGRIRLLSKVFSETVRAQGNVSQFATKTTMTREALYRVLSHDNPMPKLSTLLSFLGALGLRFAVRRLPHRTLPRFFESGSANGRTAATRLVIKWLR